MRQDRFVILACDGFWNAWTAAEALEFTLSLVANEEGRAEFPERRLWEWMIVNGWLMIKNG